MSIQACSVVLDRLDFKNDGAAAFWRSVLPTAGCSAGLLAMKEQLVQLCGDLHIFIVTEGLHPSSLLSLFIRSEVGGSRPWISSQLKMWDGGQVGAVA